MAFKTDGTGGAGAGASSAAGTFVDIELGFGATTGLQFEADRAVVTDVLTDPATDAVHRQA